MSAKLTHSFFVIGLMAILLGGCASAPEVRELAKITAANSSVVNSKMVKFIKERKKITELRADAIADLSAEAERLQAKYDIYLEGARAAATVAGQNKKPNYATLIVELQRVSDAISERRKKKPLAHQETREKIIAGQTGLTAPKEKLGIIVKKLGELGEEDKNGDIFKFYAKFVQEVVDGLNEAEASSEEAVKNATKNAAATDSP